MAMDDGGPQPSAACEHPRGAELYAKFMAGRYIGRGTTASRYYELRGERLITLGTAL
ncbi:MAG: hypothetical protein ACRC8Y_14580 [Chroococcales cyanobacterium]